MRTSKWGVCSQGHGDQEQVGDKTMGEGCQAVVEKEGQRMVYLRDEQKIQTPQRRVAGRLVSPWATHSL